MQVLYTNLNNYKLSPVKREPFFEGEKQINQIGDLAKGQDIKGAQSPETRIEALTEIYGEKALKQMGLIECATCASRTYVDGSDDPSVSFKTPTSISPEASYSAVMSHENEHVSNERQEASAEGREVISQSVQVFSAICPECGRHYTSGGVTKTTTASKADYGKDESEAFKGIYLDEEG